MRTEKTFSEAGEIQGLFRLKEKEGGQKTGNLTECVRTYKEAKWRLGKNSKHRKTERSEVSVLNRMSGKKRITEKLFPIQ